MKKTSSVFLVLSTLSFTNLAHALNLDFHCSENLEDGKSVVQSIVTSKTKKNVLDVQYLENGWSKKSTFQIRNVDFSERFGFAVVADQINGNQTILVKLKEMEAGFSFNEVRVPSASTVLLAHKKNDAQSKSSMRCAFSLENEAIKFND